MKEQLTPNELLPQDNSTAWAQVNLQGSGTLKDKVFLQAGHHFEYLFIRSNIKKINLNFLEFPEF